MRLISRSSVSRLVFLSLVINRFRCLSFLMSFGYLYTEGGLALFDTSTLWLFDGIFGTIMDVDF